MVTPSAAAHVLFVRDGCKYCELMQRELLEHGALHEFETIDVGAQATGITTVPTIFANRQRPLRGRDAFAWVMNLTKDTPKSMDGGSCNFTLIGSDVPVSTRGYITIEEGFDMKNAS